MKRKKTERSPYKCPECGRRLVDIGGYWGCIGKYHNVYRGETWSAFRPGEDHEFPDMWVSRRGVGELCTVVKTMEALIANAKLLGVKLTWRPAETKNTN